MQITPQSRIWLNRIYRIIQITLVALAAVGSRSHLRITLILMILAGEAFHRAYGWIERVEIQDAHDKGADEAYVKAERLISHVRDRRINDREDAVGGAP